MLIFESCIQRIMKKNALFPQKKILASVCVCVCARQNQKLFIDCAFCLGYSFVPLCNSSCCNWCLWQERLLICMLLLFAHSLMFYDFDKFMVNSLGRD